jgi:hypothetical protein
VYAVFCFIDLSRVLGCGSAYRGEGISRILKQIQRNNVVNIDRWSVDIRIQVKSFFCSSFPFLFLSLLSFFYYYQSYLAHLGRKESHFIMNNYFSIGVDAHVANNFHETRKERPDLFKNRHLNKAWYFVFGAKEYMVEGKEIYACFVLFFVFIIFRGFSYFYFLNLFYVLFMCFFLNLSYVLFMFFSYKNR